MATARAQKSTRTRRSEASKLIDRLLEDYVRNPDKALKKCFEHFGEDGFENALNIHLHQYVIETAVELDIKHKI